MFYFTKLKTLNTWNRNENLFLKRHGKTMHLRQRPTNKWFFEGKMWKFTIASACSTPPTSSCYLQCLINVFAMTYSSLCCERKAWNKLAANSGCSLYEPLSPCLCVYICFSAAWNGERNALYTHTHTHTQRNRRHCAFELSMKNCVRFGDEKNRENKNEKKEIETQKNYRYTWDNAYIYDV